MGTKDIQPYPYDNENISKEVLASSARLSHASTGILFAIGRTLCVFCYRSWLLLGCSTAPGQKSYMGYTLYLLTFVLLIFATGMNGVD